MAMPRTVKVAWAMVIERRAAGVVGEGGFGAGEGGGEEDQEREVGGEGVVLLVGGEGEEDQDERGEEAEEERGALGEGVGVEQRGAGWGVELAAAKRLEDEEQEATKTVKR